MVNIGTLIGGASILMQARNAKTQEKIQERLSNENADDPPEDEMPPTAQRQKETTEAVERLIEHEQLTEPSPGDKDAYASVVADVSDGATVEVEFSPPTGSVLWVEMVHMDRRDDHEYEINVGGEVSSVAHRAKYAKPRKISQSDNVIARVTNNSGSASTIDFELEGWGEVK